MEMSKINDEISKINNDSIKENKLDENFDKKNLSLYADKPTSLKYQHFENYAKKMIKETPRQDELSDENRIGRQFNLYNINIIKNKRYLSSFSSLNSIPYIQTSNNNKIRIRYNNIKSNSQSTDKTKKLKSVKNISKLNPNHKNKSTTFKYTNNLDKEKNIKNKDENNEQNNSKDLIIESENPNITFQNKSNETNSENMPIIGKSRNKKLKALNKTQNSDGYLGRKDLDGMPFTFEPIMIFNNNYSNKSEKNRHETILDEFTKLRQYIERQPENKLIFIKEFLKKHHIDYEKFDQKQLLSLCDFVCFHDKIAISNILKPDIEMKTMINELVTNIDKINDFLGVNKVKINSPIKEEEEIFEGTNSNNLDDEKENCLITIRNIDDNNDNNGDKNVSKYSSQILNENEKNNNSKISNENNNSKFYTKKNNTINYLNNKYKYNSRYENSINDDDEALKEARIRLWDLSHQKKLFAPEKNYPFNYDLIIKDMDKEMHTLKDNFEQRLFSQPFPKRKELKPINNNFNNQNFTSKNKIMFSQFNKRPKNLNNLEEIINNLIYAGKMHSGEYSSLSNKNNYKNYNNRNNTVNSVNKVSLDEIKKRLYYKPMKIRFDLNEVRRNNKLTEYYALKLARHNKFLKEINDNSYFKNNNSENKEKYFIKKI